MAFLWYFLPFSLSKPSALWCESSLGVQSCFSPALQDWDGNKPELWAHFTCRAKPGLQDSELLGKFSIHLDLVGIHLGPSSRCLGSSVVYTHFSCPAQAHLDCSRYIPAFLGLVSPGEDLFLQELFAPKCSFVSCQGEGESSSP